MNEEINTAVSRGDISFLIEMVYGDCLKSRMSAVEAIAVIGGNNAVRALRRVAEDSARLRPEVRSLALESLAGLCSADEYISILGRFITGDSTKLVNAARRLLKSADPEGFARHLALKECLDYRAISAYGRYVEVGAAPLLGRFIDERIRNNDVASTTYWGRVYIAVGALGKIGGEDATRALQRLDRWCRGRQGEKAGLLHEERLWKIRQALDVSTDDSGKG